MTLITGFGPFLSVTDNPSGRLAAESGLPHRVLEVSFDAVDEFVEGLDPADFETLLMLGVAGRASTMRVELVAHNVIGSTPDVRGHVQGPSAISPMHPAQLAGTLWTGPELLNEGDGWVPSVDAGDYLCNYIYFRAAQRFPDKPVGFLHVPPYEAMPFEEQRELLDRILGQLVSQAPRVLGGPR